MKHGYAKRQDSNHASIKKGLEQLGYAVLDLKSLGGGVPDLLVMKSQYVVMERIPMCMVWFIEIKTAKGKLNKKQIQWREQWKGPPPITAHSLEEILEQIQK